MINRGTVQTSFFNASLCLFGVLCFPFITFKLNEIRRTNLVYIHTLCLISIIIQFLIFSSKDGRPTLAYEINLSGAYLFLFFLFSDVLKLRHGKIAVICLSLLTLSRLLIFSIVLFYLVRYFKGWFLRMTARLHDYTTARLHDFTVTRQQNIRQEQESSSHAVVKSPPRFFGVNVIFIVFASYILISIFSVWYVANIKAEILYDKSVNRLAKLTDSSKELRVFAKTLVSACVLTSTF